MDTNKLIQIAVARADIALVSAWRIIKAALPLLVMSIIAGLFFARRWR